MLITDDFVFIHLPKTGGTFVVDTLKRIYPNALQLKRHGACQDIPARYKHLPIVSVMRNPYDRYVSQFHFGWWKPYLSEMASSPSTDGAATDRARHRMENPTFTEFVHLADQYFRGKFVNVRDDANPHQHVTLDSGYRNEILQAQPLGWHTEQYFHCYFSNPREVYNRLTEQDIRDRSFMDSAYDVDFLYTEELNQGLYDYLARIGHPPEQIAFVLDAGKVLPEGGRPRHGEDPWRSYYSAQTLDFVSRRERVITMLHPRYQLGRDQLSLVHG